MSIVVDIGCATHGDDESVRTLINRFHPSTLYGFDPWPGQSAQAININGTNVVLERKAAWLYDGIVPFDNDGIRSTVGTGAATVECFDLARWVAEAPEKVVLKLDVEGAEYPLLEMIVIRGADEQIDRVLVEWHDVDNPENQHWRDYLIRSLSCPVEDWH